MDISIEQVEKLRERADVTYEEARAALEKTGGNLLDAMILLEQQGKVKGSTGYFNTNGALPASAPGEPEGGGRQQAGKGRGGDGQYGGRQKPHGDRHYSGGPYDQEPSAGETFGDLIRRLWRFIVKIINKSLINDFEVYRKEDGSSFKMPVLILILGLLICLPIALVLLIVGLICGYSYRFCGPDLGRDDINRAMDRAADTFENVKDSFKESMNNDNNNDKQDR